MKILLIGGTGTIGQAIAARLGQQHEVIVAGFTHGDVQVDLADKRSIQKLYNTVGELDAVICAAGTVAFAPFAELSDEQWQLSLQHKLMGQINCVRLGLQHLRANGSFTLTSGILNVDPIYTGVAASTVNAALEGFVKAVSIELPEQQRINLVSPTVLQESLSKYADYFSGFVSVAAEKVALAYQKSVEGMQTGQVYYVNG